MDTLRVLLGKDTNLYSATDIETDNSFNIYYYREITCCSCDNPSGIYCRQLFIDISSYLHIKCTQCLDK